MRKKAVIAILLWGSLSVSLAAVVSSPSFSLKNKSDFMIGVKIYAHGDGFPELFGEWRSLGVNAVFVSPTLAAQGEFRKLAREQGISIFLILPIFFNPEELKKDPRLYALTDRGEKAKDDWVEFVCPTRPAYRSYLVERIRSLVRELDPDGISLDFVRYFVFWEMIYPERTLDSITDTCFDASCLERFQKDTGISLPGDLNTVAAKAKWIQTRHRREWTTWKCAVIADTVRSIVDGARSVKPTLKVNIHTVPWREIDFEGAVKKIAGQDVAALSASADVISPMCYWHMLKRRPPWIRDVVEEIYSQTRGRVVPSIQVGQAYISETLSVEEFREALEEALKPPSGGVIFWNWEALAKEPGKKAVVAASLKAQNR